MINALISKTGFIFFKRIFLIALLCMAYWLNAFSFADNDKRNKVVRDSIMSVLDNKNTSADQKKALINGLSKLTVDSQLEILLKIKEDISISADGNTLVDLYCGIASCYMLSHQTDKAKPYLDLAAKYEKKLTDSRLLGKYHHMWGNYYNLTAGGTKSHSHYYKAIGYYEKLKNSKDKLISVLNNLSFSYIQKDDINNLKKIADRMLSLIDEKEDPYTAVNAYRVAFYYYHSLDRKSEESMHAGKPVFGDSAIYYNKKVIDLYETNKGIGFHPEEVAYDYANLANISMNKNSPDYNKVIRYIQKARAMANPLDTAMIINANMLEGFSYYEQGNIDKAEPILVNQLEILSKWSLEEDLMMYVSLYDILMKIALKNDDHKKVLEYEQKKYEYRTKIHDKEKYQTVQDLRVKYEVDKKEQEILALQERNRYQEQIKILFISIFILIVIATFFIVRWSKTKRKKAELVSQLEKEKAQTLAIKIKEKEQEYQTLVGEVQLRQLRSYLDGLEVERSRMAKDLHDNISNELAALKIKMDNNEMSKKVITATLENIHKQIRGISHGLMPPMFTYATLPDILEDFARQQNHVSSTAVSFMVRSDEIWDDFPASISLEIYRIVQEAVGNALKYADARSIEILLIRSKTHLRLIVEDDGVGFDPRTVRFGIGLRTIRERVDSLKGSINIDSYLGKGTEIIVDVNLDI